MKILICGDRNWGQPDKIKKHLLKYNNNCDTIITGGANGADWYANLFAKELGLQTVVVEARWKEFGKAAGPMRNTQMLDLGPDKVVAFHSNIQNSKGTLNCIYQAKERGIPVEIIV